MTMSYDVLKRKKLNAENVGSLTIVAEPKLLTHVFMCNVVLMILNFVTLYC